jgi:putative transposase
MSHAYHQLYYHFVWGTQDHDPCLGPEMLPELKRLISEEVSKRGGLLLAQNAYRDHVHLLVRLQPTILVSDFIGQVKGAVAYRLNREVQLQRRVRWEEGYGVVTLREGEVDKVARYIDNQASLHESNRLSKVLEVIQAT